MKKQVVDLLEQERWLDQRALLGFDGSHDSIVRVVKTKNDNETVEFKDIGEFGKYLSTKKGLSCALEICPVASKIGGNMPLLSVALAKLGISVNAIGAFGYPAESPNFSEFTALCNSYSVGPPTECLALEFDDGKVMLYENKFDEICWDRITQIVGTDLIAEMFNDASLIGLLNWSEVKNSNEIWRKLQSDIVPLAEKKNRIVMVDLADCSMKSNADLQEGLALISKFQSCANVILSLNENEARIICGVIDGGEEHTIVQMGEIIKRFLEIHLVVIHALKESYAWQEKRKMVCMPGFYTSTPMVSTGGGDNFNAGLCVGYLAGADIEEMLYLAMAVSGYYVRTGESPTKDDLLEFIKQN